MKWFWQKPSEWECDGDHRWVPVGVQSVNQVEKAGDEHGFPGTGILWRCKCGSVKHTVINGAWTLEQISGVGGCTTVDDAELIELRKMAGIKK